MAFDSIEFPKDGKKKPKGFLASAIEGVCKKYEGLESSLPKVSTKWTTATDPTPKDHVKAVEESIKKAVDAFTISAHKEIHEELSKKLWVSLDGNFTVSGTLTPYFDNASDPATSDTHDYICPDCLAIVHDETEVPECTGWPAAMQHSRRWMEPFGGEI